MFCLNNPLLTYKGGVVQIALPLFQNYSISTCIILESYNYVFMRKANHSMFVHVIRGNSLLMSRGEWA